MYTTNVKTKVTVNAPPRYWWTVLVPSVRLGAWDHNRKSRCLATASPVNSEVLLFVENKTKPTVLRFLCIQINGWFFFFLFLAFLVLMGTFCPFLRALRSSVVQKRGGGHRGWLVSNRCSSGNCRMSPPVRHVALGFSVFCMDACFYLDLVSAE